jgi:hypothetical protein
MTTSPVRLVSRSKIVVNLALTLIALTFLLTHLLGQTPQSRSRNPGSPCTGTFEGEWSSPQVPDGRLSITSRDDIAQGVYVVGKTRRILKGQISGNSFSGNWVEEGQGIKSRGGTFKCIFSPGEHRIQTTFFVRADKVDSLVWLCRSAGTGPQPQQPTTQPSPPQRMPGRQPSTQPTPSSQTSPAGLSENHDNDQFKTFDALPKADQEKWLKKRGPRLPQNYNVSDLSLRVFVAGGWPVVLDYGFTSDVPAEMSISVEGAKPLLVQVVPARRNRLTIKLPDDFGSKPQVGKLWISALTSRKEPANFRLYGIAMGEGGLHALNRIRALNPYLQLAMNRWMTGENPAYEPSLSFVPGSPQIGSAISVTVDQPTTIRPGTKPKQLIAFSLTSQSVFSNGRWELWNVNGLDWTEVWQEKTGSINPNKPKSNKWDGVISVRKLISVGDHALQVTAWRGREEDNAWVVVRAEPSLTVVQ